MPGFGDDDFGELDFGDELPAPEASAPITPVEALFFDPKYRRHEIVDGVYTSIHPVDATVIQCLHIAAGKFLSEPSTGSKVWKLGSAHDPRAKRKVEDWVKQALAGPLSRGDIVLGEIAFEARGAYAVAISVSYTNMRLWPYKSQTRSVPIGGG